MEKTGNGQNRWGRCYERWWVKEIISGKGTKGRYMCYDLWMTINWMVTGQEKNDSN